MKTYIARLSTEIKKATNMGPRAICTGTIFPCTASTNCSHFGIHNCSTFKKHVHKPCPHYPEHDFRCIRLEGESLEKEM